MTNQPMFFKDKTEKIAKMVALDIRQYNDGIWETYFLSNNAYMICPELTIEFFKTQKEFMESVPSDFKVEEVLKDNKYYKMFPLWGAYSSRLTIISTKIVDEVKALRA